MVAGAARRPPPAVHLALHSRPTYVPAYLTQVTN